MKSILDFFPKELSPREGQKQVLQTVEANWDKADVFVIEAPTASGKTAVISTLSKWAASAHRQKSFIGTPTNILVEQYKKAMPRLFTLKKREDYTCQRSTALNEISCQTWVDGHSAPCKGCPYTKANRQARVMPYQAGNFYTYLAHKLYQDVFLVDECFPASQYLLTQDGPKTIREVAMNVGKYQVLSWNEKTEVAEFKQVTNGWEKSATGKQMLQIKHELGTLECTSTHKLLTQRGYVQAGHLTTSDILIHSSEAGAKSTQVLNDEAWQIVLGSWLGDGGIQVLPRSPNKARLRLRHGMKQAEYARWKMSAFKSARETVIEENGFSKKPAIQLNSKSFFIRHELSLQTVLDNLDLLGLAIWIMDDGSVQKNAKGELIHVSLHTNAFTVAEHKIIEGWFYKKFNITAIVRKTQKKDGRVFHYLSFDKENANKLNLLIRDFIHPSLAYKTDSVQTKEVVLSNRSTSGSSVKSVTQVMLPKFVYDIEVEDNHNFICLPYRKATSGVVAHNCHSLLGMIRDLSAKKLWWRDYHYPNKVRDYRSLLAWVTDELERLPQGVASLQAKRKRLEILHADLVSGAHRYLVEKTTDMLRGKEEGVLKMLPIDTSVQPPFLWPAGKVKKIVLLSATIGPTDLQQMGLSDRRVCWIKIPSPIAPERRPVLIEKTFDMSYAGLTDSVLDALADYIKVLLARHRGERGLIHLTYSLVERLKPRLSSSEEASRIIWHGRDDKTRRYDEFMSSENPGAVLACCGLYEGIDLPGDLGRWQAITKVPWASLADPATRYLCETDEVRYRWEALKLVAQGAGRVCRGPEDFGVTYIADRSFSRFPREEMPSWFLDAILAGEEVQL